MEILLERPKVLSRLQYSDIPTPIIFVWELYSILALRAILISIIAVTVASEEKF